MKKNRILIIAIPVLIILFGLVIYQYGYLGIQEQLSAIKEEQMAKAKTLQKYLTVIAEGPDLQKKLLALREQSKTDTVKFIQGDSFSLAAAALQEIIKGIITNRSGVISSERVGKEEDLPLAPTGQTKEEPKAPKGEKGPKPKKEKPEEKRRFKVISVSFDFTAPDAGALRDIVFFIETKTPYLVIKELDCRVRNFQQPRELMVRLDVAALYGGK
jgi:hypothetical protein